MIDLETLHTFQTVVEEGSFSAAARRLGVTQPAVSQAIESLERYLGTALFQRLGRSVRLTEAGQVLVPLANELLASACRLENTLRSLPGEVAGEMTIGCSTTSGKYLLPSLVARFRQVHPQARLNVLVSGRNVVIERVLNGEYGLGVASKRIEHTNLEYRPFYRDEVILIAPVAHRWGRYPQIFPDDLLDEPLILREHSAGTREVLLESLRQVDINPELLNVVMTLGNTEAIVMAVEEGIGIAFVSRLAAARSLEMGRVVEVQVKGMQLHRDLYMFRNRRLPVGRLQDAFWEFAAEQVAAP